MRDAAARRKTKVWSCATAAGAASTARSGITEPVVLPPASPPQPKLRKAHEADAPREAQQQDPPHIEQPWAPQT